MILPSFVSLCIEKGAVVELRCRVHKAQFPGAQPEEKKRKKKRINFSVSINLGGKAPCLLRLGCFTVSVLNHTAAGLIWVGSIDWTRCEGNWYGSSQP